MKFDKTILNKVIILPLGLVILFIVYRTLVFSVIMNCIPIMQEHYIIAETIRNCIDIMTIVVLMFIFKVKTGRGGVKGYLKGVGIYGLPVLMFTLFEIGNSTLWIFGGHAGLYGSRLIGYIVVNVLLYITVGIEEELMFRSVVTECVLRKNSNIIVFASVYSGLLFGLAHITNFIFDADMTMFNKWCTMIMACVFGFTLAVIFLRTKSIGAVITLHFLWDFADFMNHMMIVERYRYGGSYNALALQIPVLIVMLVIAVFVCIIRVHVNANNAFNKWG